MRPTARGRILVVEDEAYVRDSLGELLRSRRFDVALVASMDEALASLQRASFDAVLTDLRLGATDGIELVRRVRSLYPTTPIVVLTGHGTIASAVACVHAGASDYLLKPADPEVLELVIERVVSTRALERELRHLREGVGDTGLPDEPIGDSAAWHRVMNLLRAAAPTDSTVLLLGESGTGKELLARQIHRLSSRAEGAYVRVNCAAVPIEMWESEFFGHRRGAFTGATADRDGRFRLAHRGTIFMDEIGTMSPSAQAKILRVLEDGEFHRLGDEQPTRVDVRVVAATNSDLDTEVATGRFRPDLFYRLNVVRVEVPPLRDRSEDIPQLAVRFLQEISARLGRRPPGLSESALETLMAYAWPGNVRELRNLIERALILTPGETIEWVDLPPVAATPGAPRAASADVELNLRAQLAERERELVVVALRRAAGVRKEASRLLGIDQRNLPYYLRKHGIDPDHLED